MNVLILGASGFIGNAAFRFFSERCKTVGIDIVSKENVLVITDTDLSLTTTYIKENKPDLLINCAGSSNIQQSFAQPEKDHELNTLYVQRILTILKEHSPKTKFINLSSAAVYGNPQTLPVKENDELKPLSPYGKNKLLSEELMLSYAQKEGLKTLSLRIFSAFGIGLKRQFFYDLSVKFMNETKTVSLHGSGKESRDFIYIQDIVNAIYHIGEVGTFAGESLNLASGEEYFINETAKRYAHIFGYSGDICFNNAPLQGYPLNWKADISQIKMLGVQNNWSLEEGMRSYANWIKKVM